MEAKEYTKIQPCAVQNEPGAHTVWLIVDQQSFCLGPFACETKEEAEWMQCMVSKALATIMNREREAALEECRKQAVRILNEPFHPIGLSGLELFIEWIEEAKKSVGVNQAAG